jgi:hypothetical protein
MSSATLNLKIQSHTNKVVKNKYILYSNNLIFLLILSDNKKEKKEINVKM